MENHHKKFILLAVLYIVLGSHSLQTLTDLTNALHRNSLLLPPKLGLNQRLQQLGQPLIGHRTVAVAPSSAVVPNVAIAGQSASLQDPSSTVEPGPPAAPCTCAVFLNGQFTRGSSDPPRGHPALLQELQKTFPCTPMGNKQCQNRCLETIIKHLPNSAEILCATIGRDCHKERAYLFIQNCNSTWQNTNLSAGREYCCKDNLPYTCPIL